MKKMMAPVSKASLLFALGLALLSLPASAGDRPPMGVEVAPGLYEVHSRVLWDVSWCEPEFGMPHGYFTYWEEPTTLDYATGRTLFLSPLKGYGIPEVQEGATRAVRLYVNYGHQWMCGGTVTVSIGDVEFSLPDISGHYADMAAGWSDFKTYAEYEHVGHAPIQVYMKDFVYEGPHCGPWPGTGPERPKGTIYRIEAHFYDNFRPDVALNLNPPDGVVADPAKLSRR